MDLLDDLVTALAGRYEVERELGRGGMAIVYLARDLKHDRQVAIKVLPPERFATASSVRFRHEISTAASLTHPNILPLHDSVTTEHVRCYVMPYVVGESLRQRLGREKQLGIDEAVDIARQVAAGLDYAHARGILHRDIKPDNILLVGDQAMIADFGLARAMHRASGSPFTESGIAIGTPMYMSPEQSGAEDGIDGRADIYSLGCVLFEMIAGTPPFRGPSAQALLTQHASHARPSLREERDTCPPEIDAVVQRAMAKLPADRFRTAGELARALGERRPHAPAAGSAAPNHRGAWAMGAVGVCLVAAAGMLMSDPVRERIRFGAPAPDSNRIVFLPIAGPGGAGITGPIVRQRLYGALARWRDLSIVDADTSASAASARRAVSLADGKAAARRYGAARFVRATLLPVGDSVQLRATLYDWNGTQLRQETVNLPESAAESADRYRELTNNLLRVADVPDDADAGDRGTDQLRAWQAYTRGQAARRVWDLPAAEREFRAAVDADGNYAQAQLWLAEVSLWQRPDRNKEWGDPASRALAVPGRLSVPDSLLARGIDALADRRYPEACAAYRALSKRAPQSNLPWLGVGYCLALDPAVRRDPRSPSGWRFSGSTTGAVAAFDSALRRTDGAPAFVFQMLNALLIIEPLRTRPGLATPPDSGLFYAYPSLSADTLAFVPYPAATVQSGAQRRDQSTYGNALDFSVKHLQTEFEDWVRRAPGSADARAGLARLQEAAGAQLAVAGGGRTALQTLADARRLSTDPHQQLGLAVSEVRLLVKDTMFAAARARAESLLGSLSRLDAADSVGADTELAGVAALMGNVALATRLLQARARDDPTAFRTARPLPVPVMDVAARYLTAAAMGVCGDSLTAVAAATDRAIEQYIAESDRREVRATLTNVPLSLSVPCRGAAAVADVHSADPLVRMQQYYGRRDAAGVRAGFDSLRLVRQGLRPGDIAMDHTYQEAWLLVAVGDSAAAARYLDAPLTALTTLSTHVLDDVAPAAALVRAMALRAELAAAHGDRATAKRFAERVVVLWSGASPALQPLVTRMREIAMSDGVVARR